LPKKKTIHFIGHGHIDPTWLWRWTEGYEEVRATFRSALDRMKETPEFTFTASSACFYAWVEACDPTLFEEIRARVKEGRWEIAGGWWIEPDCNIPAGESFVRQGLYAQRFFQRAFGMRATVGFNPDSFGHDGALPQIFRKLGIDAYVYHRPCPEWEMDYPDGTTFWWEAADGSRVLAVNILIGYAAHEMDVRPRIERLADNAQLNPGQAEIIGFYGVGNHGGGPTKRAIAEIKKAQRARSLPRISFSTLRSYCDAFLRSTPAKQIPVITSDLQHHARGCYSAHAGVKAWNRRAEHALMAAERFATVASLLHGHPYPGKVLEGAWKDVLYNQFHDILAGTSLESSYEDSRDQLGAARHAAHEVFNESIQTIARNVGTRASGNTIVVFNPLPWPVKQTVTAPPVIARTLKTPLHVVDHDDKPVASQEVLGERIDHTAYAITADVPALGYRCYHARSGKKTGPKKLLKVGREYLENAWWRIDFDPNTGEIARLRDKKRKVAVLEKGNILAAMVDASDTWSHGCDEFRVEAGRLGNASLEVLESGPVRATVRIVSRYNNSLADQQVTIYHDHDAIDCVFRINWQERYTMLKLAYETTIDGGAATYDTAYGHQVRDTEGFEEPGQKWFDLSGKIQAKHYGLAVLNDCKYGFDVRDSTMRVTLLRSPLFAHHDRGRVDASLPYSVMDQGWHTVRIGLVPHAGDWRKGDVVRRSWALNEPLHVHGESAHKGTLPAIQSFLRASSDNVALTVLKQSEDQDDIVVRGYETAGRGVRTTIHLVGVSRPITTTFAPHEIKTLRITRRTGKAVEVNLLEEPL
jgi:alpha-mannosidase